jgi:large subunit ribosomal protein L3
MRVLAVRFYKGNNAALDILAENLNKELKRKIKTPKKPTRKIDDVKIGDYDDVKIIVYTLVKNTGIKKTPDIAEMGLKGTMQEKFDIAKDLMKKEIKIGDIFEKGQLIDVHSVTKGKGFAGPVKRFGLSLKQHKSEKGVRRPGSLGPWHPARVTFRAPLAGQLGFFSRIQFNNKIIDLSSISSKDINPKSGFQNYGTVRGDYLVVKGSVSGSRKRALLLTFPMRTRKRREKEIFELVGVEK